MLSVVIPTHQRSDLLQACLQSVTRHAPAGTEIIVVDDNSPNGAARRVASSFPGVRVISSEGRGGFARAANRGIQASSGEIVEVLNDDTEVQAGWADAPLAWFHNPGIGAVAPLVLIWPDGNIIDSAGDRYYVGGVAGKRGHLQVLSEKYLQACQVFGTSANAGFYRRSALGHAGIFPEYFNSYFEDVDLAFRLWRAGYSAMFEPTSRVLHHVSASYGPGGRILIERQSCNEERVFWRNIPASALAAALPKHLAVLAGKAWRRGQEQTLTPWIFGRLRAWTEWRAISRHRAEIAARFVPRVGDWYVDDQYWNDPMLP